MARRQEEIKGDPRASHNIQDFLARVGGRNPFGDPHYRLVHTATRFTMQGGAWKEWDEGLSVQERGGMIIDPNTGLSVPSTCKPNRIVTEMRWVKKYVDGFEGWLVERWMPASHYGAQSVWESLTLPNRPDIQLLGPYPSEGDYECCSDICPEIPSMEWMHEVVKFQSFVEENRLKGSLEQVVLDRVTRFAEEYERQQEQVAEENEYRIKEFLSPWTSSSLGAGRWRQQMAEQAGVKEHAGN